LERISAYTNARDLLGLSPEDLKRLRSLRFSLGYLGLESGSAKVLELIRKGAAPKDMIQMARVARDADIALSTIVLLGAGGSALTDDHIRGTIEVVNAMQPAYLSFLTAMIVPHTSLMTWAERGTFEPLTDRAILREAHDMLFGLELKDTLFRMNHVSNMISLGGRLPKDKKALIRELYELMPRAGEQVTCVCNEEEGLML
jgi:histone acetyltransferase (RNA polymerase elongator complex component)